MRKQGTIKTYDMATRTGILTDDAQTEFAFDADSFRTSGLREFRLGQRVKFTLEGDAPKAKVRDLTIVSF